LAQSKTAFDNRYSEGGTDEWLTPPEIIHALGEFDLDPCAPKNRPWDMAKRHYDEYGLESIWFGRVWCNPPYGNETGRWLRRLAEHGNGIALIFARTETDTFFRYVWNAAHALLFIKGRLSFHKVDGSIVSNSGAPSVLIAYGVNNAEILRDCSIKGKLINLI
jgi:hypothetical protein